jgi:5-methylcytosine-specific restriction endonuclease McrA
MNLFRRFFCCIPKDPITPPITNATALVKQTSTPFKQTSTPVKQTSTPIRPYCTKANNPTPYKKDKIPKALREQIWLAHCGQTYSCKCKVTWCTNNMTVFDFQAGHNIPESKGGATNVQNLIPICSRCNSSMGNRYTIDEWNKQFS